MVRKEMVCKEILPPPSCNCSCPIFCSFPNSSFFTLMVGALQTGAQFAWRHSNHVPARREGLPVTPCPSLPDRAWDGAAAWRGAGSGTRRGFGLTLRWDS